MVTRGTPFDLPLLLLRQEIAASELLPRPYDRYLPLLADGLSFFLERLSPPRMEALLAEQLALQGTASLAQRVVAILRHLPALHKLGQVVARDRRLHPGFRRRLQQLESLTPQLPVDQVRHLLQCEFKDWHMAGIQLGRRPLAEGSVAVIMPFVWRARRGPRQHGVFKLLKPEISSKLEEDLELLTRLAHFLDEDCERLHLPALDYQDTFSVVRDLLLNEVRFEQEQKNLAEARRLYGALSRIHIPALLPFCFPKLTAMERLFGHKISSARSLPAGSNPTSARAIVEALIATPIFTTDSRALFHADPHAGNLLLMPGSRVGVLDWSLSGRLRKIDRIELVQLALGALTHDVTRMERAVDRISQRPPAQAAVRAIMHSSLGELVWGSFPGITWLTKLLDRLVMHAGLRLSGDLLLFRKSLLTLSGVLADLAGTNMTVADTLLDRTFMAAFMTSCLGEWPGRFLAPMDDRAFPTHLSNADLIHLIWSAPTAWARWCQEVGLQSLRGSFYRDSLAHCVSRK